MNYLGTKKIETERLILRKFKKDDANEMFKNWGSDPEVTKFLSWKTHTTVEDAERIVNIWIVGYKDLKTYNWAIEVKEIGEIIGNISIVVLEEETYSCEIGYCIGSKYWNNGIASEAFKAVIDFLFDEIGFNRICAKYDTNNIASGKVMAKCNMVYEGTLRESSIRNGILYSLGVYSLLRKEWENKRNY